MVSGELLGIILYNSGIAKIAIYVHANIGNHDATEMGTEEAGDDIE